MRKAIRTINADPIKNLVTAFEVMYHKREEINQAFNKFIVQNEDPRLFDCVRNEIAES
jgi:hypothetical protein